MDNHITIAMDHHRERLHSLSHFLFPLYVYNPSSSKSLVGTLLKPRCSGLGLRSPAIFSFSNAATAPNTTPTGIHFCSSFNKASRKSNPLKSSTSNIPKINPKDAPINVDILKTNKTCRPFSTKPPPLPALQHAPKHQFNKSIEEKTKAKHTAIPRTAYNGTLIAADHLNNLVSRMKQRRPETSTKPAKTVSKPFRATLVPEQKILQKTRAPIRINKVPKYYQILNI